jgi:hypothetical protein
MAAGAESRGHRVDERPLAFYEKLGNVLAAGLLFR